MKNLHHHLINYGIRYFTDPSKYQKWQEEELSEEEIKKLLSLLKNLKESISDQNILMLSEFSAIPRIGSVLHSMKADAIEVGGSAVESLINGNKILDIGCGIGYLTSWYASIDSHREVVGIDFSSASITTARSFADELGIQNVSFKQVDITNHRLNKRFDVLISTQCLGFLVDKISENNKLGDLLEENGVLISVEEFSNKTQIKRYVNFLRRHELQVSNIDFVYHVDLGALSHFVVIQASLQNKETSIDLDTIFFDHDINNFLLGILGIAFQNDNGKRHISIVWSDTTGAENGVKLKDKLISLNQLSVEEFANQDFQKIYESKEPFRLGLERDNELIEIVIMR